MDTNSSNPVRWWQPVASIAGKAVLPTTLAVAIAVVATGCAGGGEPEPTPAEVVASRRESVSSTTSNEHAIEASGEEKEVSGVDVTKTGDADGDEADFYGTNAAVYAEEGATLTLDDVTVDTAGKHANAVFSYGEGTTVNITNSAIHTSKDGSGGIMVTGGGTLNATDLDIHTEGVSSAAIRSDRGGGTEVVDGGTYATDGKGSPVVYSTADVTVKNAKMVANASEGVVVEGKNSVTLEGVDLTASNTENNSDKTDTHKAVMIYQSMSGDAAEGEASFAMTGGSLTNKVGDVFFVNNTVATITLDGVTIANEDADGSLMRIAAAGWGNEGSNGGHVTVEATDQELAGDIVVDSVSTLNLHLGEGTTLTGSVNADGLVGEEHVSLTGGAKWVLTADSHVTSLTCSADSIDLNGHVLYVGDAAYEAGTESVGADIVYEAPASAGQGMPGGEGGQPGQPGDGTEPPAKPDGESGDNGGEPPAKPDGSGSKPSAKPSSSSGSLAGGMDNGTGTDA